MTLPKHQRSGTTAVAPDAPDGPILKPGYHLVEDEQRADTVTRFSQPRQEALRRRNETHVGRERLHDHARHIVVDLWHDVEWRNDGVGDRSTRHARRIGKAEGRHPATRRRREACPSDRGSTRRT